MAIKTYKPTTPSRRHMTSSGFEGVEKHVKPERSLIATKKKHSGRNSYGRITVRHKGGGNRQKYRIIDFKRNKFEVEGTVLRLEYDPNRTAFIALVEYTDGERRYILAPVGLTKGDKIVSSPRFFTASSRSSHILHSCVSLLQVCTFPFRSSPMAKPGAAVICSISCHRATPLSSPRGKPA